jgi:hypothetical protein
VKCLRILREEQGPHHRIAADEREMHVSYVAHERRNATIRGPSAAFVLLQAANANMWTRILLNLTVPASLSYSALASLSPRWSIILMTLSNNMNVLLQSWLGLGGTLHTMLLQNATLAAMIVDLQPTGRLGR